MSVSILLICMMSYWLTHQRLFGGQGLYPHFIAEAKKMADQAMKDPMSLVNNVGALKFW